MALGLILFTAGARLIPAAQAGLISLLEVVLGPLWVWLIYREAPDALTLARRRGDRRRRAAARARRAAAAPLAARSEIA